MATDEREALIAQGWKQGALISQSIDREFLQFAHFDASADDIYLVTSQTCDLVNPNCDIEPFFEVLRLEKLDGEPHAMYAGGKNSRIIHFKNDQDGAESVYSAVPYERFFVDKKLLHKLTPNGFLSENARDEVIAWLTKRISRTAFPEVFVQRVSSRIKKIEKVIKKMVLVKDIYMSIVPFSEIDSDADYVVEIYLLMGAEDFDNEDVYAEYDGYRKELEDHFGQCSGIDLQIVELRSDAEMSIGELEGLSRWDYSYLSYRDAKSHASPLA